MRKCRGLARIFCTGNVGCICRTAIRRAGTIVPHRMLIEEGWGLDADVSFDSLYVFIRGLRAKLTKPGELELLHTIRGVGYSLRHGAAC